MAYADQIIPTGVQDGVNQTYTLPVPPNPAASLKYYYNGILMSLGVDYTLSGASVTYILIAPFPSDRQVAYYRY